MSKCGLCYTRQQLVLYTTDCHHTYCRNCFISHLTSLIGSDFPCPNERCGRSLSLDFVERVLSGGTVSASTHDHETQEAQSAVKVQFAWRGPVKDSVSLTGDFVQWRKPITLPSEQGLRSTILELMPGSYRYQFDWNRTILPSFQAYVDYDEFIVDGQKMNAPEQPTELAAGTSATNIITVTDDFPPTTIQLSSISATQRSDIVFLCATLLCNLADVSEVEKRLKQPRPLGPGLPISGVEGNEAILQNRADENGFLPVSNALQSIFVAKKKPVAALCFIGDTKTGKSKRTLVNGMITFSKGKFFVGGLCSAVSSSGVSLQSIGSESFRVFTCTDACQANRCLELLESVSSGSYSDFLFFDSDVLSKRLNEFYGDTAVPSDISGISPGMPRMQVSLPVSVDPPVISTRPPVSSSVPTFSNHETIVKSVSAFAICFPGTHLTGVVALASAKASPWTAVATKGVAPPPRSHHTMTKIGNKLYILFGRNGPRVLGDIAVFDLEYKEWQRPAVSGTPPSARYAHTACPLGESNLLVFGGTNSETFFNDIHVLHVSRTDGSLQWTHVTPTEWCPMARAGHVALITSSQQLYIFGGYDGRRVRNDAACFDIAKSTWSKLDTKSKTLGARAYATSCIDYTQTKMLVYGGRNTNLPLNDGFFLDLQKSEFVTAQFDIKTAPTRWGMASVLTRDGVVFYGGCSDGKMYNDGYLIRSQTNKTERLPHPLPSPTGNTALCSDRTHLYCYGGSTPTGALGAVLAIPIDVCLGMGEPPSITSISVDELNVFGFDDCKNTMGNWPKAPAQSPSMIPAGVSSPLRRTTVLLPLDQQQPPPVTSQPTLTTLTAMPTLTIPLPPSPVSPTTVTDRVPSPPASPTRAKVNIAAMNRMLVHALSGDNPVEQEQREMLKARIAGISPRPVSNTSEKSI